MQLRQLEYVAAIVRWKTMRRAAQELYISEATMSEQIRALESEFGFPLFERDKRFLRLTSAAEQLLPDLHTLLHAKKVFEQNVAEIKNPATGHIRLGVAPDIVTLFLPTILQEFRKRYPRVKVDVREGGAYPLADQVKNHLIDIALFASSDLIPFNLQNLRIQRLDAIELVALASQHHHLAHKENISKVQLVNEEIITYSEDFIVNNLLDAVLGSQFARNSIYSTNSSKLAITLAQAGVGIIFAPRHSVEAKQERFRGLVILNLAPEVTFPGYHVCVHLQQHPQSEHLRSLTEIIRECFHSTSHSYKPMLNEYAPHFAERPS